MKKTEAIKELVIIQMQFQTSLSEAEMGEEYAIESKEDNEKAIEALEMAIRSLKR